jgi:hypothetical protein
MLRAAPAAATPRLPCACCCGPMERTLSSPMRRPMARLSDKVNRTEPDQLRAHRGAALPGQTLVVYDPDTGLAVDQAAPTMLMPMSGRWPGRT